jgi:hypothetical protein
MASTERADFFTSRHIAGLLLMAAPIVGWLIWSVALDGYGITSGLDLMAFWVLIGIVILGAALTFDWIGGRAKRRSEPAAR